MNNQIGILKINENKIESILLNQPEISDHSPHWKWKKLMFKPIEKFKINELVNTISFSNENYSIVVIQSNVTINNDIITIHPKHVVFNY